MPNLSLNRNWHKLHTYLGVICHDCPMWREVGFRIAVFVVGMLPVVLVAFALFRGIH